MNENQLRQQLQKKGYKLQKSKKPLSIDNLGGYMITEMNNNSLVSGSRYELTLEDVQEFINE
jgi:hypothetical protein